VFPVILGTREAPFEIGEGSVTSLSAQRIKPFAEKGFV
jgi:hypothetical protein